MAITDWIIAGLWVVLVGFWGVSALGAKKSRQGPAWWRQGALRLLALILIVLAARLPVVRQVVADLRARSAPNVLIGLCGAAVCALGVALAIWARISLGRDWGTPMSRREDPELVTTGPYALIRHPIYAGFLLAGIGATIGQSIFWIVPLVLGGGYFLYSALQEEQFLLAQFPDLYPRYRARTKMLIPFLL